MLQSLLSALGGVTALLIFAQLLSFVWTHFVYTSNVLRKYKGAWAVVTGASAGIGAGMARVLAKKGLNVVLIARSAERLEAVAADVRKNDVDAKIITFDFANADQEAWDGLLATLAELEPSVLVNNVGVNVSFPTDFLEVEADVVQRMHSVNIDAASRLTRALLPAMVAARKGVVLFLSSAAGVLAPSPLLAPYAGTKAYLDAFALALAGETPSGVHVHSLTPFFVESGMAKMRRSFTVPSADAFALQTVRSLGASPRLCPHWPHAVMAGALRILPLAGQVKYVADLHKNIRKRALRKQAKLAAQTEAK